MGGDEVALRGLVEHEFQHLGPVVGVAPGGEGLLEGVHGHQPGFLLVQEVRVCGCDGHEVDFGVELCLEGGGEGDGEGGDVGGAAAGFGGGGGGWTGRMVVVVGGEGGGGGGFDGGDEGDVLGLMH